VKLVRELLDGTRAALRRREYFDQGGLKGYYPYSDARPHMVYIVKSGADVIALFDGDVWHISDSDFHQPIQKADLNAVKQVIGEHDEYSMFPVVPTLAAMDALLERLEVKEIN
jgi:hypothetical protein